MGYSNREEDLQLSRLFTICQRCLGFLEDKNNVGVVILLGSEEEL